MGSVKGSGNLGPGCKKNNRELSLDAQGTVFFEAHDGYARRGKKIWQRISTPHTAKRRSQLAPAEERDSSRQNPASVAAKRDYPPF